MKEVRCFILEQILLPALPSLPHPSPWNFTLLFPAPQEGLSRVDHGEQGQAGDEQSAGGVPLQTHELTGAVSDPGTGNPAGEVASGTRGVGNRLVFPREPPLPG